MANKKKNEKMPKFKAPKAPFVEGDTWKADPESMDALSHIEPTEFKMPFRSGGKRGKR